MSTQADLTVTVKARITAEMDEALRELAEREERPVGWLVRKAIDQMLSTEKNAA